MWRVQGGNARGKIAYFGRYGCVSVGCWMDGEGECVCEWSGDAAVLPVMASARGKRVRSMMARLGLRLFWRDISSQVIQHDPSQFLRSADLVRRTQPKC